MRRLPPLNWLRSFEASARALSFTHAAQELCLTQAAVSKHVKSLEYNLGRTLFTRLPHGLELTHDGAAYLPAVRDALDRLSNATQDLFDSKKRLQLNVRTSLVYYNCCLAHRISEFYQKYPDIEINFSSFIWVDNGGLEPGIDLEVRYGRGDWDNLIANQIHDDSLLPVASPKAELGRVEDLSDQYLLHCVGYAEGWEHWLQAAGFSGLKPKGHRHFDTLISAFQMAEMQHGVALGRSSLVEQALSEGRLVAPFDYQLKSSEAFYLVHSNDCPTDSPAAMFKDWLLDI